MPASCITMKPEPDELELAIRARGGDAEALAELTERLRLSLFALAYAELGAMMPDTGGQYVYLREAYGPLGGFISARALRCRKNLGSCG